MARFDKTIALVTGGARGMGAEHVRGLVAEGARVVIGDVLEEEGKALAADLGSNAVFVKLDVTKEQDWEAAIAAAEKLGGPLTLLVNNAGVLAMAPLADMPTADFKRVIDINLLGTFLGIRYAVPPMRKAGGGVIINISSTGGMVGYAGLGAYVASKWAVRGLTKTAALELGHDNIRVMSVHPGGIRTPMTEGMSDEMAAGQAIPRFGEIEEVTKMVLFLASEATFSTGSEFVIDGGVLLGSVAPIEAAAN